MKLKKIVSLLLVGGMAMSLLAGCGSSEADVVEDAGSVSADSEAEEETAMFDELQEIDMYGLSFYGEGGVEEVVDAINEIAAEEINVNINFTAMDVGSYSQQIGLMLSGGESFDLLLATAIPAVSFNTMYAQGELMDISGYLDEYAPDIKELLGDYLEATSVGDAIYGIPCYRLYNSSTYIVMRKDILDELGLTEQAQNISSWSDFEEILLAVQAAQDSLPSEMQTTAMISNTDAQGSVLTSSGVFVGADDFSEHYGYDMLGDQSKVIYVDENGQVGNYFATDEYKETIERVHEWYEEGLVYKDAATSEDTGDTLMQNGVTFSYVIQAEYGVEASKSAATGYDVVCVNAADLLISSGNASQWAWCVPVTSSNPEAAVAFMNLMYTNAEVENLFVYGIEGTDYEVNEDGEAVVLESGEYQSSDFFFGNQFLAYPQEGSGSTFREDSLAEMNEAEVSEYMGLVVDTDAISNELTAVSNALAQYEPGLESGSLDPELLDDMLADLEAAGVQTIIDFYQDALDTWLAEQ